MSTRVAVGKLGRIGVVGATPLHAIRICCPQGVRLLVRIATIANQAPLTILAAALTLASMLSRRVPSTDQVVVTRVETETVNAGVRRGR